MKQWLWFLGIFTSCALLTGCVSSVPLEARVNQLDNGGTITLQQGQELVVELERNPASSHTLMWRVVSGGIKIFGAPMSKTLENQQTIVDSYTFTALFVGKDQLRIEEQSQQTNDVESITHRVFTLNVTVTK